MALTFLKKTAGGVAAANTDEGETMTKPTGASWIKRGAAAKTAYAQEEAKAELRKQDAGKLWDFWMPEDSERQITFLDGKLDEDGMLECGMFHQHNIRINGSWERFVCTVDQDETQPCPICESGDRPALVGVMTIIDHTEHVVQKGPNKGKVIKNTRKLFIAKNQTIKMLTKLAAKRGGLQGCTFDVARTGDKEASVGNQFDFVHKFENRAEIMAKYDLKEEDVMAADYEKEIRYRSPQELIELGVGKAHSGVGYEKGAKSALKDEL